MWYSLHKPSTIMLHINSTVTLQMPSKPAKLYNSNRKRALSSGLPLEHTQTTENSWKASTSPLLSLSQIANVASFMLNSCSYSLKHRPNESQSKTMQRALRTRALFRIRRVAFRLQANWVRLFCCRKSPFYNHCSSTNFIL